MQICHSFRRKQIDISTADCLMLIFRSNTRTPLSTLRGTAATLKFKSTSCTLSSLILSSNYNKSIYVLDFIQNECITAQLLFHVGNEPKRKLNW